jgi:hypothetical protein
MRNIVEASHLPLKKESEKTDMNIKKVLKQFGATDYWKPGMATASGYRVVEVRPSTLLAIRSSGSLEASLTFLDPSEEDFDLKDVATILLLRHSFTLATLNPSSKDYVKNPTKGEAEALLRYISYTATYQGIFIDVPELSSELVEGPFDSYHIPCKLPSDEPNGIKFRYLSESSNTRYVHWCLLFPGKRLPNTNIQFVNRIRCHQDETREQALERAKPIAIKDWNTYAEAHKAHVASLCLS